MPTHTAVAEVVLGGGCVVAEGGDKDSKSSHGHSGVVVICEDSWNSWPFGASGRRFYGQMGKTAARKMSTTEGKALYHWM